MLDKDIEFDSYKMCGNIKVFNNKPRKGRIIDKYEDRGNTFYLVVEEGIETLISIKPFQVIKIL